MHSPLKRLPPLAIALRLAAAFAIAIAAASRADAQRADGALAEAAQGKPAVAAALEMDRSTPAGQLRAVFTLLDLGEPAAAALVLPDLVQAELSTAQRADLVQQFGPARFLELIRRDRAGGSGRLTGARQFAQGCLNAAAAAASDPARVAKLIAQLKSDDALDRDAAIIDLRGSGDAGIAGLLAALAQADDEELRRTILHTLGEMRPGVDAALVAGLAGGDGQFRRDLADLAGQLNVADAGLWLAALAAAEPPTPAGETVRALIARRGLAPPTPGEIAAEVRRRVSALQAGVPGGRLDAEDQAGWHAWNPATKTLTVSRVSRDALQVLAGARLLDAAETAGPLPPDLARQAVSYRLQRAAVLNVEPAESLLAALDQLATSELSVELAEATVRGHGDAARHLIAQLGERKDFTALVTADGRPSPLAAAAASPDRRVRFAAVEAIMAIKPQQSFPGASFVPQALWQFAAGGGRPAAIVASSKIGQATAWAGQLRAAGYDAVAAQSGLGAIRAAIDPNVAGRLGLIALDSDLGSPHAGELLYQVRTHATLRDTPVAVLSSLYRLSDAQRWAAADRATLAVVRPRDAAAMKQVVARAAELPVAALPDRKQRERNAAAAMKWLAELLADAGPYDELERDAPIAARLLFTGDLVEPALTVLRHVGSRHGQVALVEAASNSALPMATRTAAAEAFAANVADHGLHLTRTQQLQQFDRYNASETADAATQQVLALVLDVIEEK